MSLRFGTDGIRGVANSELTPELALAIGLAASDVLEAPKGRFFVGRDTRKSGPLLQAALSAGLASGGMDVVDIGVVPTPGVAFIGAQDDSPSAAISASHNPFGDNGIKFFQRDGRKLTDEVESRFEARLEQTRRFDLAKRPTGSAVGGLLADGDRLALYLAHLVQSVPSNALAGQQIVLDCANGASTTTAVDAFSACGADVSVVAASPDGCNINAGCGSTHIDSLAEYVTAQGAQMGFAFDGDADRIIAVDHEGNVVDGDHLLAMMAIDMSERSVLNDNTLVITVMANLGLKLAMKAAGIAVHETSVGDRYVLDALEANAWSLGGEQSGHIIVPSLATTGDGVLVGLQVAALVARSGRSLRQLASVVTKLPQVLHNVRVRDRDIAMERSELHDAVARHQRLLGEMGRILLRPSGTEPLIRVMVEAPFLDQAETISRELCELVEQLEQ